MKKYSIAIIGATGAVGQQCLKWLHKFNFPFKNIEVFASKKSAGRLIRYQHYIYTVQELKESSFDGKNICFFCTDEQVSQKYVPIALKKHCLVIDNSSFYRLNEQVPLIVSQVNTHLLANHPQLIANPNCVTSILCSVLKPLDALFSIQKVVVSTYQSVSGIGYQAMQDLKQQTRSFLDDLSYSSPYFPSLKSKIKYQMAFNCIPQVGSLLDSNHTTEEEKIIDETQKILEKKIKIFPTCVRVPTLNCHCESVYVEFEKEVNVDQAIKSLKKQKNLKVFKKLLPINTNCVNQLEVFISRIRKIDHHALSFYLVSDNLLKGAASNAIEIALSAIKENENAIL